MSSRFIKARRPHSSKIRQREALRIRILHADPGHQRVQRVVPAALWPESYDNARKSVRIASPSFAEAGCDRQQGICGQGQVDHARVGRRGRQIVRNGPVPGCGRVLPRSRSWFCRYLGTEPLHHAEPNGDRSSASRVGLEPSETRLCRVVALIFGKDRAAGVSGMGCRPARRMGSTQRVLPFLSAPLMRQSAETAWSASANTLRPMMSGTNAMWTTPSIIGGAI
jgi:hypothetical protein